MDNVAEVVHYHVEDGDVLFVDSDAVDCQALAQSPFFKDKKFVIVPVCTSGKSVKDCLVVMTRDLVKDILEENL